MISGSLTALAFASFISDYLLKDIDGQTVDLQIANVDSQLHTLNLPKDIINLIPYVKIQNSPQSSVQPTGSFIDKLARTVATVTTLIVGAIVAVANFIGQIGEAVVDWCIKVVGAFVDAMVNVIKAVVDAIVAVLNALADAVLKLVGGIIDAILQPIFDAVAGYVNSLGNALLQSFTEYENTGTVSDNTVSRVLSTMMNNFFLLVMGIASAILAILIIITGIPVFSIVSFLIMPLIITLLADIILGSFVQEPSDASVSSTPNTLSGVFTLARAYMENNVHSPSEFAAILNMLSVIFGTLGTGLSISYYSAVAFDISGIIGLIFGLSVSIVSALVILFILSNAPTGETRQLCFNALLTGVIAFNILALCLVFAGFKKAAKNIPGALILLKGSAILSLISIGLAVAYLNAIRS